MLSEIARFNAARRYGLPLFAVGALLGITGLAFIESGYLPLGISGNAGPSVQQALMFAGASLWIAAAGFISAALMSFTRQGCVETESRQRVLSSAIARQAAASSKFSRYVHVVKQFAVSLFNPDVWRDEKVTEWPLMLIPLAFGAAAAFAIVQAWLQPIGTAPDLNMKLLGGGLIVLAFPLLVLQRHYAGFSDELLPEAPQLERLTRVPLAACTGIAIAMILVSAGFSWGIQIERVTAIILLLVAAELMLRSITTLFLPPQTIAQRRAIADSSLAGFVLRLTPPSIRTFNVAVRRQFGVDLSRSWALAFVLRAALPIAAGIGVFAWLVTGVTALPLDQRGVYQRFGVPVAVFGPGLHVHLPWPMGIVTTVEIGVVHQLPIEFVLPAGNGQPPPEEKEALVNAEAAPPPSADRLWDDAHPDCQ